MSRALLILLLAMGGLTAGARANESPAVNDNAALAEMFRQDQLDRTTQPIDWVALEQRDRNRREQALGLLAQGQLRTASDHYHAAMLFQHGGDSESYRLAHALATIAMTLAPEQRGYRWLAAAAWDRLLMSHFQPQWYGTQYRVDDQGWYLYPVAEGAVDDAGRLRMGVPSLEESRARVAAIAERSGGQVRPTVPSVEEIRAQAQAPTDPED